MRHALILIFVTSLAHQRVSYGQAFKENVEPLISSACMHCHDVNSESHLKFDDIDYGVADAKSLQLWEDVFDRIQKGEMPPESEPRPDSKLKNAALSSLKENLQTASRARQKQFGRVPARRLTKVEIGYTLRDLLGIEQDVTSGIPDEVNSGDFDTVGATQRISAVHMESYLKTADAALDLAIQLGRNPYRKEEFDFLNDPFMNAFHELPLQMGGSVTRKLDDGVALFIDADYLTRATNFGFRVETPGVFKITSTAAAFQSDEPVTVKLILREPGGGAKLLRAVDLHPRKPETFEVNTFLKPGDDFYLTMETGRTLVQDFTALAAAKGAKNYEGAGVLIKSQSVEGPLFDVWPPKSTRELLHGRALTSVDSHNVGPFRVEVPGRKIDAVSEILKRLAPRIFRRPPAEGELHSFLDLAKVPIADEQDFLECLRVPLRSMLSSPQFLMFDGEPSGLDGYAVANRLSYFLWKSMPDDRLFQLARNGRILNPAELDRQVDRLLNDDKSQRFIRDFLGQWLRLNQVNATTPDAKLYPEYDEILGQAIPRESEMFFAELIKENLSLTHLIESDFAFLNSRLADHYGIENVSGQEFRKVSLPEDSPRGGILTQAAVLKTTANGTVTSPVMRGNFVLTNFLGMPPARPPASVGSIEPDTQGRTTIREILAAHRDSDACNKCHREIDPPGFALECFDPVGRFRTHYRSHSGKSFSQGPPVDASGKLANGKRFSGIKEFKRHLLHEKDQVARNFISQLIVYSTGGEIQFADREEIDAIVEQSRTNDYRVRSIIQAVVRSAIFRNK